MKITKNCTRGLAAPWRVYTLGPDLQLDMILQSTEACASPGPVWTAGAWAVPGGVYTIEFWAAPRVSTLQRPLLHLIFNMEPLFFVLIELSIIRLSNMGILTTVINQRRPWVSSLLSSFIYGVWIPGNWTTTAHCWTRGYPTEPHSRFQNIFRSSAKQL